MAEPHFFVAGIPWTPAANREPDDPMLALASDAFADAGNCCDEPCLNSSDPELQISAPAPLAQPAAALNRSHTRTTVAASLLFHIMIASALLAAADPQAEIAGDAAPAVPLLGDSAIDMSAAGDALEVTLISLSDLPVSETAEPDEQPVTDPTPDAPVASLPEPQRPADEPASEPQPDLPATPEATPPPFEVPLPPTLAPLILTAPKADPVDTAPNPQEKPAPKPVVDAPPAPRKKPERVKPAPPPAKKPAPAPIVKPVREITKATTAKPAKEPAHIETKPARKKASAPKPAKPSAGNGGSGSRSARRGSPDGSARAGASASGKAPGRNTAAGNAAVSNYPGKVAAKLRRAVRGISRGMRARATNDVHVSFVVSSSGAVGSIRITRSSGSPELDAAARAIVQRAAPFPPIPAEAGRSSWQFAFPLGLAR